MVKSFLFLKVKQYFTLICIAILICKNKFSVTNDIDIVGQYVSKVSYYAEI
jgi:hypothetical protein